jgi:UDP-N-acetylmuramyl pentapeptide synthase
MKQKLLKILYRFLAFCARVYLMRTKPFVIGVTGSVGKTNCREVITQVLQQIQGEKKIYTSPKNYNSELGLVFSIFEIEDYEPGIKNLLKLSLEIFKKSLFQKKQYDILVAEYGIDTS